MPAGEVGALMGAIFYAAFGGENRTTGLRPLENHTTALRASEMQSPFGGCVITLPGGKHVTGFAGRLQLPYESSSFATPAVRWGGKRKAP